MKQIPYVVYFLCAIYAIFCVLSLASYQTELDTHYTPDYPLIEITPLLEQEGLSENDALTLFYQTGLTPLALDDLRLSEPSLSTSCLMFQENFFKSIRYECHSNSIISKEEGISLEISSPILAPLKDGDILVSSNSHTFFWRNGHVAIVTDAKSGETLESVVLGENSVFQSTAKWTRYPNFIVLRLKDASSDTTSAIAKTAKAHLLDVPYDFTVGILSPKEKLPGQINGTQCAHLVWEAFYLNGYDIDGDGGCIVTPNDILNSELLEIVQLYGVNPKTYVNRF